MKNIEDLLTDFGKAILKDRYLLEGESFEDLFRRVAKAYSDNKEHEDRIFEYFSKMWFMAATPILSNGGTSRGLPISCFLNEIQDNLPSIADIWYENVWLASSGGGIGTYMGNIRSINEDIKNKGKTSGIIPFAKVIDSATLAISQGCYDEETEVLTEKGFIKFSELPNYDNTLKIAQVNKENNSLEFVNYTDYIKYNVSESLYHFRNIEGHVDLLVTGNHRMAKQTISRKKINGQIIKSWNAEIQITEAEKFSCNRDIRFINAAAKLIGEQSMLTPEEQFLIAYQADGETNPSGTSNGNKSNTKIYNFHISKERKLKRLMNILGDCGYYYTIGKNKNGSHNILVRLTFDPTKQFNEWINIIKYNQKWCKDFIEEISYWDGSRNTLNTIQYYSIEKNNADIVQIIAIMAGYKTKLVHQIRNYPRKDLFKVLITKNSQYTSSEKIIPKMIPYNGNVYCITVPSNLLVIRRNGAVTICGNSLRRGSAAIYLDVSHPEIEEFIDIRRPIGGDVNRRCLNIHHGVVIPDAFMKAVEEGKKWQLRSPTTHEIKSEVDARDIWIKILNSRIETGEPYILFIDAVNRGRPEMHKKLGLKVKTSNLCSEITLPTGTDHLGNIRTAVCCLSSLNLEYFEEWEKDINFIPDVMRFLDNVLTDFIKKAPKEMKHAVYAASRERSVGMGVMGFHSFLQSKMIPIEGVMAKSWNKRMFKHIKDEADKASKMLAEEKGSCPDAIEAGVVGRFANKCVTPDTTILTPFGYSKIINHINDNIEIWNGHEWSEVVPFQTSLNSEILKISFDNDKTINTTLDHKFIIQKSYRKSHIVEAKNLQIGDKLGKWEMPIIEGSETFQYAYSHGFFCGDGSYNKSKKGINIRERPEIRLYGAKKHLINFLDIKETCTVREGKRDSLRFYLPNEMPKKFLVPTIKNTIKSRLEWLAGLFDADGNSSGTISSNNKQFLLQISEMLEYTGIICKISKIMRTSGYQKADLTFGFYYILKISLQDIIRLEILGFKTHRVVFNTIKSYTKNSKSNYTKIINIEKSVNSPTYCLTESKRGTALFNGIKTMQCAVAPTASISVIAGNSSPGIDPFPANVFTQKTLSGSFVVKNKYLLNLLRIKGHDTAEIWSSIATNGGSVNHLPFLTSEEKDVFKTAFEINQMWLVEHSADRTEFICQAQSFNLFFPSNVSKAALHIIAFASWKKGLKSLYYCRTQSIQRSDNVTDMKDKDCLACQ